jgi:integrase
VQEIRPDLGELLRPWLNCKAAGEPVFNVPEKTARMLRADLTAAREAWIKEATNTAEKAKRETSDYLCHTDRAGTVVDFHALRHTYITMLAMSGAPLKVVQAHLRQLRFGGPGRVAICPRILHIGRIRNAKT